MLRLCLTCGLEVERGAKCLVQMDPETQATKLLVPEDEDPANKRMKSRKITDDRSFTFDNSFWSHDEKDAHYAHQEDIYNCLGEQFLDHNFEGYHTCIFAYGQTGSGKSYTMMGTPEQPGLIPRTCHDLFERIDANDDPSISFNVRVSYFEVYNEHVRDLLAPRQDPPHYLKIRESPIEGPYVKDLTDAPVRSISEILRHMKIGDANRTTASTKMNDTSSRSHAVFTIMLKQIHHDMLTDETTERLARIRLVDLAGSERAKATEATGARLREGSNINKSLTTLGRVIAALADPKGPRNVGGSGSPGKQRRDVVPYRDSILTWLLKDSLGGNSNTAMLACIAPADYDETLSTLRYADQAKRIRTRATVNQDHVSAAQRDAQINLMAEHIRMLELQLADTGRHAPGKSAKEPTEEGQDERLEEYQGQVGKLQRLMEERGMVADGKIRKLQEDNDTLRLHLKLAIESINNPIRVPPGPAPAEAPGEIGAGADWSRRSSTWSRARARRSSGLEILDEADDEAIDVHDERAHETQEHMRSLLRDLALFRRKLTDDMSRFRPDHEPCAA
jgi:DNA-binding TFAR19-related protein (PDSD5 family)